MLAKREIWKYATKTDVWIGKYLNSRNLPHWHLDCELLSVESGQLDVVCENKTYTLNCGDAFFIDSEQVHYMQAKEKNTVLRVIIFHNDIIKQLFSGNILANPKLNETNAAENLYDELKQELRNKKPFYNEAAKAIITRYFVNVLRNSKTEPKRTKTTTEQLKSLLEKIENEYDSITFDEAYKFMAMDEAYFCRYFKKACGMTFSQYLNHRKIDNAIKLMKQNADLQVTDAAISCGFGSIRYFNKTFKEFTGYTPKTLPPDFALTEYAVHTDSEFNPTLADCLLMEQY